MSDQVESRVAAQFLRDPGLFQEANRVFFQPRGYNLVLKEDGTMFVEDCTAEGIVLECVDYKLIMNTCRMLWNHYENVRKPQKIQEVQFIEYNN